MEVSEVAREKILRQTFEARRQARGVSVEFSPEMNPAIVSIVRLKDVLASNLALETDVGLIAFGDSQTRVEAARKVCFERAELFDDCRVRREHVGKVQV